MELKINAERRKLREIRIYGPGDQRVLLYILNREAKMKRLLVVPMILISTNAFAMGFTPPPPVALDTPQEQAKLLASAYAVSQAEGDAMKKNLAADPSYIHKFNQPVANKPAPLPFVPIFPF